MYLTKNFNEIFLNYIKAILIGKDTTFLTVYRILSNKLTFLAWHF
jgi:hypothetical protein